MSDHHFYCGEITEAEAAAGFKLMEVLNPEGHFYGNPPTVPAVVYEINESERIIKINSPLTNGTGYLRQIYGVYPGSMPGPEDWKPHGAIAYPTLDLALRLGLNQVPVVPVVPKTPPPLPSEPQW